VSPSRGDHLLVRHVGLCLHESGLSVDGLTPGERHHDFGRASCRARALWRGTLVCGGTARPRKPRPRAASRMSVGVRFASSAISRVGVPPEIPQRRCPDSGRRQRGAHEHPFVEVEPKALTPLRGRQRKSKPFPSPPSARCPALQAAESQLSVAQLSLNAGLCGLSTQVSTRNAGAENDSPHF
jgi:hypothetical protein